MFTALGPSQAIISKRKLSQLQGSEDSDSRSSLENESTLSAPTGKIAETETGKTNVNFYRVLPLQNGSEVEICVWLFREDGPPF